MNVLGNLGAAVILAILTGACGTSSPPAASTGSSAGSSAGSGSGSGSSAGTSSAGSADASTSGTSSGSMSGASSGTVTDAASDSLTDAASGNVMDATIIGAEGGSSATDSASEASDGGGMAAATCPTTTAFSPSAFCQLFVATCTSTNVIEDAGFATESECETTYGSVSASAQTCRSMELCNASIGSRSAHCPGAQGWATTTMEEGGVCM